MTEIVIQGIGGRMGHVLCDMIAQREDCRVVAGIDMKDGEQNGIPVYDSLEKLNGKGDVIIDFSSPAAVEKALPYCQTHKMPIVVCTTGLSEELQLKVVQLSRSVPVFKSANMSMGINVLAELCKRASAVLGINYDIEIVEQHHHNKLDAPSGTALMLADAINEQNDGAYPASGYDIEWITYDLHENEPAWNIRTEHEGMFTEMGIKIKALIARKKPGADSVTWVDPKVLKRMAREAAAAEAAAQEGEGNV